MDPTNGAGIAWLHWCSASFARARAERKPVLLSVVAPWSGGCAEMDRVSYGDPAIAARIARDFVPIRVDADHRPDIAERYDLGGLPTTAFLDAAGQLLGGGTFVPAGRLSAALDRAAAAPPCAAPAPLRHQGGPFEAGGHAVADASGESAMLLDLVFSAFDDEHAGFSAAPKFPLTAPVWLAVDLYAEEQTPAMLDCAVRTLDAMGWGPLYDERAGGFFRCAAGADWSNPPPEKLLAPNAALLDLYVHAGTVLGHERWFARAVDVVHYINRALVASNGAWRISECADATRQFTDSNAAAASAMLHAAAVFQDEALGKRALDALERVLLVSYKPGQGVAHSGAGVRGLLADQVAMAAANLDAWESTGNIVYRMMAEELMHYALRAMWDERGGGFFDRAIDFDPGTGCPAAQLKPFTTNCDAALVLRRLAVAVNDAVFAKRADETLTAISGRAAESGPLAAHYLIARRAVLR